MESAANTAVSKLDQQIITDFREKLTGDLFLPSDQGYNEARKVWNGMIDRQPALIVRCKNTEEVIHAVNLAREHNLLLSVRAGGHNITGNAVCDGGIMVDLSLMKTVKVDPEQQIADVETGATWSDFDAASQKHGLATTCVIVSTTGVAGLTLGGGVGWLVRKHGLSCDNLIGAEVVTAEGTLLKASANENQELFWGIRGGGGNFGIVTSMKFSTPDAILFDFSNSEWHFTLEGAVKIANAYPNSPLLLNHWGSDDAPDFAPFNANPKDLYGRIVNPKRIYVLAPGQPFTLKRLENHN